MRSSTTLASCSPLLLRYVLFFSSFPFLLFFCVLVHGNVELTCLYQDALAPSVPIDPPHLPWKIYAYGPNGFAREHPVPHNTNVMGYPFTDST